MCVSSCSLSYFSAWRACPPRLSMFCCESSVSGSWEDEMSRRRWRSLKAKVGSWRDSRISSAHVLSSNHMSHDNIIFLFRPVLHLHHVIACLVKWFSRKKWNQFSCLSAFIVISLTIVTVISLNFYPEEEKTHNFNSSIPEFLNMCNNIASHIDEMKTKYCSIHNNFFSSFHLFFSASCFFICCQLGGSSRRRQVSRVSK